MRPPHTRRARLALACVVFFALGCRDAPEQPALTARMVMYEIDHYTRAIEPHLRNPERLPEVVRAGKKILEYVDHPSYAGYAEVPSFRADKALYHEYRDRLRGATEGFVAAAEQGDIDAMHRRFSAMTSACIACHKRFNPAF